MSESLSSASKKSGLAPGTLVHVGEVHEHEHSIMMMNYNSTKLEKHTINSIEELLPYKTTDSVTWVIIDGLKDIAIADAIGQHFDIHPLVLEDILNTNQRTKFEEYPDYLYFVIKATSLHKGSFNIEYEQISILVLKNFVFTFMEKPDALFDPILNRLNNEEGHLRNSGSDYLAYVIMDTVVDEYFTLQDAFDELIESIEDDLLTHPSVDTLVTIQKIRRELIFLRKTVSPLRELLAAIRRSESPLFDERTKRYFADIYDHSIRIIEAVESYRELISGMLDIYLSSVSNKMNETMKFLTVFASIFIPLTFIAGVYGMNFEYMPELKWKWSYPILWSVFIAIAVSLLFYFKKKKWL
ncbi:MAG: magnesium/cobalt transporter CorA [Methylococcales bacterium]|nr:magnesium/cobalt transporter CorA [Methylococcales bacterium]